MILPIFNVLDDMDNNLINAGAMTSKSTKWKLSAMSSSFIDERGEKW